MSKILYFYGTNVPKSKKQKAKRITVAGVLDDNKGTINIGLAACSHKDQFNKAIGRNIASGRAFKTPFIQLEGVNPKESVKVFIKEAKSIISNL